MAKPVFKNIFYKNGCSVNALCSIFPKIELSQRGTVSGLCNYSGDRGYRFALKSDMGIDTVDKFRQFITDNPLYVTAELAVPVTYQLTPAEVRTLLGVNNIWADTGSVSVEYRADTRRYIDSLTAPDRDMTADANIQSGKYFIVNNRLFLSTAAIAQGAAIVPGSNCSETDLAQALNALNS